MKNLLIKTLFVLGVVMTQSLSAAHAYEPPCWFEGTCNDW